MLSSVLLPGCTVAPTPVQTFTRTCNVPLITPQTETKEAQEKGGIEISIAPVHYTVTLQEQVELRQVPPPMVSLTKHGGQVYVERITKSTPRIDPENLRFVLKVNNKMARVFHGAGTIVQFNVGGRLQAVDQGGYHNFLGAIIPPRQELQIEVVGPSLTTLTADKGVIGLFIYDVVTKQNDAGVVLEKQNFEWYFDYVLQHTEQAVESHREEGWISVADYQQELARKNVEAAKARYPNSSR